MPGLDNKKIRAVYELQRAGEFFGLAEALEMVRKDVLTMPAPITGRALQGAA